MRCKCYSIAFGALCLLFGGLARASVPTGSLESINANTGLASGHASDADRAGQSILIDFWLGPGLTAYIGGTATVAGTNAFSFQLPMQYRDGLPHQICAWAINQVEPHTMIGCKTFAQASTLPTGTLSSISASGLAAGAANDADRPGQSILVDFWIGTGYTTYVGGTSTQASTGAFSFQIPAQYRDGVSRSFCAWAINDVEPHVLIGCKSYQYVDHLPTGLLTSVDSNAVAKGNAHDPDLPGQEVQVKFYQGQTTTSSNYLGTKTTLGGSFAFSIPVAKRVSGEICAYAVNTQGTTNPRIGCAQYVKPGLAYYGYYTSSTPFRLGMGDHTDEVTDHANLAWVESNDCYVLVSSEDRQYCDLPSSPALDRQSYLEVLPGSGRTIDFFDLMSRVAKAKSVGDKTVLHLQQFLFAGSSTGSCFYLRSDADAIIQGVSRQLYAHGLMDTVVAIYPIDEPYLRASSADEGICRSAADQTPFATVAERNTAIRAAMTSILASVRAQDPVSGAARFPGKATALILSVPELGWADATIPADYDWVGYDGYIATGESTQDYNHFIGLLKAKIASLPNATAKRIMLVPEAYIPEQSGTYWWLGEAYYSSSGIAAQCTNEVRPPSTFVPVDDGHRAAECVLLSNFLKAYRLALCDPSIVAIVPFIWQEGMNATFPVGSTQRYRDLTNYLVTATLVGEGISSPPYALPVTSCPSQ